MSFLSHILFRRMACKRRKMLKKAAYAFILKGILFFVVFGFAHGVYAKANNAIEQVLEQRQTQAKTLNQSQSINNVAPPNTDVVSSTNATSNANVSQAEKALLILNRQFVFVLFYRATCPHCRAFEPTLITLAKRYGFQIQAFTTDGSTLPELPQSVVLSSDIKKTFFNNQDVAVPTLFLMNVENGHSYPVSEGELTYDQLSERLTSLAPKIIAFEDTLSQRGQA